MLTTERNSLQQKLFEMQSEFCSIEIERDLEKETSRYLEEQLSSLNSSLSLKDNELVSLRKRYKLLNEGFSNSETLREGLERDVSDMTRVIREVEERLEISEEKFKDNGGNQKAQAGNLSTEYSAEKIAKLEAEVFTQNETLAKERSAKATLEEMFANGEKERSLLLKEVEGLRNEHEKQIKEVNVLRELLHDKNKQEQMEQLNKQQLQRAQKQEQQMQNEEISELRGSKTQFSCKIAILEDENKKLEDELDQQLTVLEKLEIANKSFAGAKEELGEISCKLKSVGFHSIGGLIADYTLLQQGKLQLEARISQLKQVISNCHTTGEKMSDNESISARISTACPHFNTTTSESTCVPKSEHLRLRFQLKSLTEEINSLKQASSPKITKKVVSSASGHDHRSRKDEHKIAKKWLKTIKDSMNVVVKEEEITAGRYSTVLLETKLHEANIRIEELVYELETSKKENTVLLSANAKRTDEVEALKRSLIESEETQNSLIGEMKTKLAKAERQIEVEIKRNVEKVEKIASLEEQNQEMCVDLVKSKEKIVSLQKEKDEIKHTLESLNHEIFKNFGNVSIQTVSKTLSSVKEKSFEYVKIIDSNKNDLLKLEQDWKSLQQVNTVLCEELADARVQLEKKDEIISEKYLKESISEKREADRLQVVTEAFERSKQNEKELLAMCTKQKEECEKLQEELKHLLSELQETKILLSNKETECEATNCILRELQATCEVYEEELNKSTASHADQHVPLDTKESNLSSGESQDDELSEDDSDSTAENFREMQEMLHERMAMKVEHLQNRLEETMAALSSCQKLNTTLRERLHAAEKKILESEKVDGNEPRDELLEAILKKLAEKEREIQEILEKNLSDERRAKQGEETSENSLKEMASRHKKVIKELKIDNAKNEVRLSEAYEKIAKLEEKLAASERCQDQNSNGTDVMGNVGPELWTHRSQILDYSESLIIENVNATISSASTDRSDNRVRTNVDLKEELDCMTAKYVNLKAAFEGCLRRLKILETGEDVNEGGTTVSTVNLLGAKCNTVQETIVPTFIGDVDATYQRNKSQISECTTAFKDSSFSEISCSLESGVGPESDRMVVEITLTESDLETLNVSATRDTVPQEGSPFLIEYWQLKTKVGELEKITSSTKDKITRVKESSMKQRLDFENRLKLLQESSNRMEAKLLAVEEERDSAMGRLNETETKHLETKRDLQRIKISAVKDQQHFETTVKELKCKENNAKKRMMELENDKQKLRKKVEELQRNLEEYSFETQRVKTESFNAGKKYKSIFNELERKMEGLKTEKETDTLRISKLGQQLRMHEDDMENFKTCSHIEMSKHQECIRTLQNEILTLKRENQDLQHGKDDALLKNSHLVDEKNAFEKDHELKVASLLEEAEELQSRNATLQTTMATIEEKLILEKTRNDELESKFRKENEEREDCLVKERETFEDTRKRLQDIIMILEKETAVLETCKNGLLLRITELEHKIEALKEDKQRNLAALFDEKQSLQNRIMKLQDELQNVNTENDNVMSKFKAAVASFNTENQMLKDRNEKLESQNLCCVDEIQRIKLLSLEESTKLEAKIKHLDETGALDKETITEYEEEVERLTAVTKDFETKCVYILDELERVKICSFRESQVLADWVAKLTESLSSMDVTYDNVKMEKHELVLKVIELEALIVSLQEELQRIKVCTSEERENMDKRYNTLLKQCEKNRDDQLLQREKEISSLRLTLSNLDDFKKTHESENQAHKEEIDGLKVSLGNLENEKRSFEKKVLEYEQQISTLTTNSNELNEKKLYLEAELRQREDQIVSGKMTEGQLQNEKEQLRDEMMKRDEQVFLLQIKVSKLEEQRMALETDMLQKDEEESAIQVFIENVEKEEEML